jgi:hypothetical protein
VAYVDQQPCDAYAQIDDHARHHKAVFDKCVLDHHPGEVTFKAGDLLQVPTKCSRGVTRDAREHPAKFMAENLVPELFIFDLNRQLSHQITQIST